jgi:integral membrane protein (TIGR01906 family)
MPWQFARSILFKAIPEKTRLIMSSKHEQKYYDYSAGSRGRVPACFISFVFTVLLIYTLLITSAEAVCYRQPGWFEKEYTKYDVLSHVNGEMSMDSALEVTDEMMLYLKGRRDDLTVYTTIDGERVEFFTNREKAHLEDVRNIFIKALTMRNIAAICYGILLCIMVVYVRSGGNRQAMKYRRSVICKSIVAASVLALVISWILAYLYYSDFTKYFTIFHEIFFDNDLWILYPSRDNLINLLPEGFFVDTALRSLIYFLVSLAVTNVIALAVIHRSRAD